MNIAFCCHGGVKPPPIKPQTKRQPHPIAIDGYHRGLLELGYFSFVSKTFFNKNYRLSSEVLCGCVVGIIHKVTLLDLYAQVQSSELLFLFVLVVAGWLCVKVNSDLILCSICSSLH